MQINENILYKFKNNYFLIFLVIEIVALLITIELIEILVEPLTIFYLIFVSILFSALISLVIYETGITALELNLKSIIIIFFSIYVLLSIWFSLVKGYPEYKNMVKFQNERDDLLYEIGTRSINGKSKQLAELYMFAPKEINRIIPHVNHKGVIMMDNYLTKMIDKNEGAKYADDMYATAEVAFTATGRDFAKKWYELAYKYGKKDALIRYKTRMEPFKN